MAKEFVLTTRLRLLGPETAQIDSVLNTITDRIRAKTVSLGVVIDPNSIAMVSQLNSQLKATVGTMNQLKSTGSTVSNSFSTISNAVNQTTVATKKATSSQNEFNSSMEQFGHLSALAIRRNLAFTITAFAVYGVGRSLHTAVGEAIMFDREMVKLRQLSSESDVVLKGVESTISQLSMSLGVSSNALIKTSNTLIQAGYSVGDTKVMMDALAKTTLAPTFGDIKNTTEGLIAILHQFNLKAYQSEQILGSINKVAADYAMESSDVIEAAKRSGSIFSSLGGNFNEFIGILTAVRQTTRLTAETIATGMNTIFARMQRPATLRMLEELGIKLQDVNAAGQKMFVGPMESIRRISDGLKNIDPRTELYSKVIDELGGIRQLKVVIPMIRQRVLAEEAMQKSMDGTSSLSKDVVESQKALSIQFDKVKEKFLDMTRTFVEGGTFRSLATGAMTFARALIDVANALQTIAPLLAVLGGVSLVNSGFKFMGGQGFLRTFTGKKAATGGMIPGTGDTDTVPALLTPGEFVIRKSAVKAIGRGPLEQLNRYASGGIVTGGRYNYGVKDPDFIVDSSGIIQKINLPTIISQPKVSTDSLINKKRYNNNQDIINRDIAIRSQINSISRTISMMNNTKMSKRDLDRYVVESGQASDYITSSGKSDYSKSSGWFGGLKRLAIEEEQRKYGDFSNSPYLSNTPQAQTRQRRGFFNSMGLRLKQFGRNMNFVGGNVPTINTSGGVSQSIGGGNGTSLSGGGFSGGRAMMVGLGLSMLSSVGTANISNENPRAKGAFAGLSTGLATTGSIAMMSGGNPIILIGAALAGLAHGVYAYTRSIKESNDELKRVDIEKSFINLTKHLESFQKSGKWTSEGGESLNTAVNKVQQRISEYQLKFSDKTIDKQAVLARYGAGSDFMGAAVPKGNFLMSGDIEELTKKYQENKDQFTKNGTLDIVNSDIERRIASGSIKNIKDLGNLKDVGGAYKEIFLTKHMTAEQRAGAEGLKSQGLNADIIYNEVFLNQKKLIDFQVQYTQAVIKANNAVEYSITRINNLADSFSYITEQAEYFDNRLERLSDVMSTSTKTYKVDTYGSSTLKYPNINPAGAASMANTLLGGGQIASIGQQATLIKGILPGIIEQLGKENKIQGAEGAANTGSELFNRLYVELERVLPGQSINRDLLTTVTNNIEKSISSGRQSDFGALTHNPQELAKRGTEGVIDSFNESLLKLANQIEKAQSKYMEILNEGNKIRDKITEQREVTLQKGFGFTAENRKTGYELGLINSQFVTPNEARSNFAITQQNLGVKPGQENNVNYITSRMNALSESTSQLDLAFRSIQYDPKNIGEAEKLAQQINNNNAVMADFNKALLNCANSTEVLSTIQGRLGELEKARSAAFGVWMGKLGMTRSERIKAEREDEVRNRVFKEGINPESLSIREQNMLSRSLGRTGGLLNNTNPQWTNEQAMKSMFNRTNQLPQEQTNLYGQKKNAESDIINANKAIEGRYGKAYIEYNQMLKARSGFIQQNLQSQQATFNIAEFNVGVGNFSSAVNNFVTKGDEIATKLASAKDMNVTATHKIEVNVLGLAGISDVMQKIATDAVNKALGMKNKALNQDKPASMVS
jgi:TP901 family phage tail tape measure protein